MVLREIMNALVVFILSLGESADYSLLVVSCLHFKEKYKTCIEELLET
jgi:hypothetical protein